MSDTREEDTIPSTSSMKMNTKKVPKPVMEKRRRERINRGLETLRVFIAEATDDEKMKNPKVEKAEILESVVQFLKTQKPPGEAAPVPRRVLSQESNSVEQQSFHGGKRFCAMRVNHFMAHKSQEGKENEALQAPFAQASGSNSGLIQGSLMSAPGAVPAGLPPYLGLYQGQVPSLFVSRSYYRKDQHLLPAPAAPMQLNQSMWRPWPE